MENSDEIQIDPRVLKVLAYIAAGTVVVAIFMAIQAAYFETSQWIYFTLTVLGISCASLNTILPRKILLFFAGLFVLTGLGFSTAKFDWRRSYIQESLSTPFPYEAYIDRYPTLEEHIMAQFGLRPNWVGFKEMCHDALKKGNPIPGECRTLAGIKENFGIDMRHILRGHFRKMKKTADLIYKKRLVRKQQLENCLRKKECALVPMLPPDVDASQITEDSREHLQIRRTFWEIIDNKTMTPKVCLFNDLCRDLGEMGALDITNPRI